ncbi:MAG: methyltransferase domain-containing protein [Meiothermus sp.]|nr:methyltransferase domain-containing protein [Meiothermus sp.]
MPWNPDQYNQFRAERSAPFFDLLSLVKVRPGLKVVDLGCGTGELTRRLADHLPDAEVLGLDYSADMLSKSAAYARTGLYFEQGDIRALKGEWDLIFSNAALQWLEDHASLIPTLWSRLKPGGQLVVQMPANHDHPSYRLVRELVETEPFCTFFPGGARISPVLPIEDYAQMLFDLGGTQITAWMKVYPHVLEGADAMVEWVRGTLLLPYLEQLSAEHKRRFLALYTERLNELFPQKPVFFGFKRVLLAATKP